ncbi:MAG: oligosaccharide flippase family protein [candidate division Zixibacteria bacterium]|nr:oligosaccharide flippase family protein [Candidatus Tariuqbacter arcticus]
MDLRRHIGKGIWALFDKSFTGIYGFALVFFVVGKLDRGEYGIYIIVFAITNLSLLFNKGFVLYPMTKYEAEEIPRPRLLGTAFLFSLASQLLFGVLWFFSAPILAVIFNAPELCSLVKLIPLALLGFFFRDFSLSYLQAHRRVAALTLLDGVYYLGMAVSFIALNYLGKLNGAIDVIWVHIIFAWSSSFIALFPVLRRIKFDFAFSLKELRTIFRFGRYSLSMGVGEIVFYQFDLLLLGIFYRPETVAMYNAAKLLFRLYSLLSQSLNLLIYPGTSLLHSQTRLSDIKTLFEKVIGYYWSVMLVLNIILFAAAGLVLDILYSGKYPDSVLLLRIFLVFSFFEPLYNISMNVLYGMGKPEKAFKPLLIAVPVFLTLNILLIPSLKGLGAAISFNSANIIVALTYLKILNKELDITLLNILNNARKSPILIRNMVNDFLKGAAGKVNS